MKLLNCDLSDLKLFLLLVINILFFQGIVSVSLQQQVILVLDHDKTIHKIGHLQYQKHDTSSHVLMWDETSQKLHPAKWSPSIEYYEVQNRFQQLPIGPDKLFSWKETVVKVVGIGNRTTISGFSAESLISIILKLTDSDIGLVDIIAMEPKKSLESANDPVLLRLFMVQLKRHKNYHTNVTMRLEIEVVDHSGNKLKGQLKPAANHSSIEWKHTDSCKVWKASFKGDQYQIQHQETCTDDYNLKSRYSEILPSDSTVYLSFYKSNRPTSYLVSDNDTLKWIYKAVNSITSDIFLSRASAKKQSVILLTKNKEIKEMEIIELYSVTDLLNEILYYRNRGVSDRISSEIHYRFGYWIIAMNETTFEVSIRGVIANAYYSHKSRSRLLNVLYNYKKFLGLHSDQMKTGINFFDDVIAWINGENGNIELSTESSFNALCGIAMFLSEPIRHFPVHITNMMSLDLFQHNYLSKEFFVYSHPMTIASEIADKNGLYMLQKENNYLETDEILNQYNQKIAWVVKSWFSHMQTNSITGSRELPPAAELAHIFEHESTILYILKNVGLSAPPFSLEEQLRVFEVPESSIRLLSTNFSDFEADVIHTNIMDFFNIDANALPVQASIALNNDHVYVSQVLKTELQNKEVQTGKKYLIVPKSIEVDKEGELKVSVKEAFPSYSEPEQLTITLNESQLQSKEVLENIMSLSNRTSTILQNVEQVATTINGINDYLHALDNDYFAILGSRTIELGEDLEITGNITFSMIRAAAEYLGKSLKPLSQKALQSMIGKVRDVVKSRTSEMFSSVIVNYDKNDSDPVKTLFHGIDSIRSDFQKNTTLGFIDGLFDTALTALSFVKHKVGHKFGEIVTKLEVVISVIKMGVDFFYRDISQELSALSPNPSIGEIAVAVFKGFFVGVIDIVQGIVHNLNPFAIFSDVQKINEIYRQDQYLLSINSNYKNYFHITESSRSNPLRISFVSGEAASEGGDIEFHLGEDGDSVLSLQVVDFYWGSRRETHNITTTGVSDIILGIGESHFYTFKTITNYFGFIIPINTKTVITGVTGERDTLHGTYYGNSHNNKFIAVQELPPQYHLGYKLADYVYKLFGGGGNDTFYLGPQRTYVEGNEGSDTYFISSTSTYTEINSHSGDGQTDIMMINLDFCQLTARREGNNLNISSSNTHIIILKDWFSDVSHQRVIFHTKDGVLFKVSATITKEVDMIPYALNGLSSRNPVVYDSRQKIYSDVVTIIGSEHNDYLIGNDLGNQLNGGGGYDRITGGNGRDTYTVDFGKGVDTIDNFAMDGQTDILILGANLTDLLFTSRAKSNNLYISLHESSIRATRNSKTGAVILNWFSNETFRHMTFITDDKELIKVSSVKNTTVDYLLLIMNMSNIEPHATHGDPYTRKIDLNSNENFAQVLTVLGTSDNDSIVGNHKDNYITGGQGLDYFEGREGADTYAVKENDGSKIIMNCANDTKTDTLLIAATYDEIDLQIISESDAVLSCNNINVVLKNWFKDNRCQHMVIHSKDGITFKLLNKTQNFKKVPKIIDNSDSTSEKQLILSRDFETVERVIGSQGDDQIIGNSNDNYLDPGKGNSYLKGGNGSDTYVIRHGQNIIITYAEDGLTDNVQFMVPFLTIQTEVLGMDTLLTSFSEDGLVSLRLEGYNFKMLEQARHLYFTTIDGVSFFLPVAINGTSMPIATSINRADTTFGQNIDLTCSNFSEVLSLFGSSKYQNTLKGNNNNNVIVGGASKDLIEGKDGDDLLRGGNGDDILYGGSGVDTILGENGNDVINGGEDNDVIAPGSGFNRVDGGEGTDTVLYNGDASEKGGIHLDLKARRCFHSGGFKDSLTSIEIAYGTAYDDILHGDHNDNVLVGQNGNDYLSSGSGYDILIGGNGHDTYHITAANNGTVTIDNYAYDMALDVVEIGYADMSQMWYEIKEKDVILRVINSQYRVFYDDTMPIVVFKNFMNSSYSQHICLKTPDGNTTQLIDFITSKPSIHPQSKRFTSLYLVITIAVLIIIVGGLAFLALVAVILGIHKCRSKRRSKGYIKL